MKLYHLTREAHLDNISEHGLLPTVGENVATTFGIPVVWLSANKRPGWNLSYHADHVILTVEPSRKRLAHWRTWFASLEAEQNGTIYRGREALASLDKDERCRASMQDSHAYYVYFGVIPPSRIKRVDNVQWCAEDQETETLLRKHQKALGGFTHSETIGA